MGKKIGFIGAGNMAEALISGIIKSGVSVKNILVSDINSQRLNYISKKYKVKKSSGNAETVKSSDIVFLAIKPYQVEEVLKEVGILFNNKKLLVSIAAGITTTKIEKYLRNIPVIRSMPNTPALLGYGAIAITKGKFAKTSDLRIAEKLLFSCGVVVTVSEKDMDAVTAVSGSGPAYVFYVAEVMRKTAVKLGLSNVVAKILVDMTLLGASSMLITSEDEPEVLRQRVTSKGGTTEAAFKVLSNKKFGDIFEKAIVTAKNRSKEMS
ncbi:MAG: pyrroline-5-carboxylate reductase [Elusimicrobia bacterium RIFOXYD2_FULL_34_15]|nr:MAG: pyrroline-5-carboxylate reductase [Elusimicrobia bacterium RIFOXYD2_FULL_34_15]